jgi:hypothetical protein
VTSSRTSTSISMPRRFSISISFQTIFHLYPPFCLQPLSRAKDVVIPITLKYGNQSRTFTYTILAEEAVPIAPVVAAQHVAPDLRRCLCRARVT